jgi:predicted DsbA family dithiol-disulfide isomerase
MSEANTYEIAKSVGVDVDKARADLGECQKVIENDQNELRKWGVSGTPAFFINGEFVGGGIPKDAFKQIIDKKLKTFEAAGVPAEQYYEKVILGTGDKTLRSKPSANPPKC